MAIISGLIVSCGVYVQSEQCARSNRLSAQIFVESCNSHVSPKAINKAWTVEERERESSFS